MMIVAPLSKQAGIVAFDKETGKEVWKSEALGGICWTSPFVTTVEDGGGGVDMVVMLVERDSPRLVGLDAATGKKLWMYKGWKCANPITSQTYCGDGKFFVSGGYKAGSVMVQVKKDGDAWKAEALFQTKECGAWSVKPVFFDGYLYANSTDLFGAEEGKGLMCMDLTGKVMWQTSNKEKEENGSILVADGKIYQLFSESGLLKMAKAVPEGYQELGAAKVTTGKNIWAPMAISDGKLLVRNRRTLICLDVADK
jgi:outer membrane protein assembly factor BamB